MIELRGFQPRIILFPEPVLLTIVLFKLGFLKNMQGPQTAYSQTPFYILLCSHSLPLSPTLSSSTTDLLVFPEPVTTAYLSLCSSLSVKLFLSPSRWTPTHKFQASVQMSNYSLWSFNWASKLVNCSFPCVLTAYGKYLNHSLHPLLPENFWQFN